MIPWECGREGQLAVPPHFRRHQVAASFGPGHGGRPAGHGATGRGRSSPRSGGSSPRGARPPSQLPAALSARVNPGYSSPSTRCPAGYGPRDRARNHIRPGATTHCGGRSKTPPWAAGKARATC
ncbi:hypothetical protein SSCG_02545 [Streptomyces clavuligerus]|nr:hypothetical protein SSCG_02545 [Streptomyces clavuligerus]